MHLHRKFLAGKEKFDQQRKSLWLGRGFAGQFASQLPGNFRQTFFRKRSVRYLAIVTGKPHLTHRLLSGTAFVVLKRRKLGWAPHSLHKLGAQQQWIKF